jgi:hypothetical protein
MKKFEDGRMRLGLQKIQICATFIQTTLIHLRHYMSNWKFYFKSIKLDRLRMGKISMVLFALFFFMLNSRAQDNIAKSRWNSEHIIIDGNDWEWPKPLKFYDEIAGLQYAICNDYKKIYIVFKCDDPRKIQKMLSVGWSVNLSSNDMLKRMNATIIFPGMKKKIAAIMLGGNQGDQNFDANLLIKAYLSEIKAPLTLGFHSDQKDLALNNWDQSDDRIDIAIGVDKLQNIIYEIAIPFKDLQAEDSFQPNELISMIVIVNAMNLSTMGGGRPGALGGMGGGRPGAFGGMGGGRPGGMHPGGGAEKGSPQGNSLFERVLFKQQFILSKKSL